MGFEFNQIKQLFYEILGELSIEELVYNEKLIKLAENISKQLLGS